jgi:hypothetical protein
VESAAASAATASLVLRNHARLGAIRRQGTRGTEAPQQEMALDRVWTRARAGKEADGCVPLRLHTVR